MRFKPMVAVLAAFLAIATALPSLAQQGPTPARLRGTVEALNGDTLTIATREGTKIDVLMQANWTVQSVLAVKIDDIKAGDFVGASAIKRADGKMAAQAIHYLDPAIRERAQGDIPWDLTPESLMINADLGQVVRSADGVISVKMTHNKATYDLVLSPTTPIVRYAPGDKSLLAKGKAIFIGAQKQPNGTYTATLVRAETNGVKPPL
jgi:Domain of unknown function (DUF5666)